MKRRGREVEKKIAKKTYEVFLRVSRAYGARHGNVSCVSRFARLCTALHRRAGRVRNHIVSAKNHSLTGCFRRSRAKNTFWGVLVSYGVAAVGNAHPQGWGSMGEKGAVWYRHGAWKGRLGQQQAPDHGGGSNREHFPYLGSSSTGWVCAAEGRAWWGAQGLWV